MLMTTEVLQPPAKLPRLEEAQIQRALDKCPRLPSLGSINNALRELLNADQRYTSQIAEVIRRDPSLTARLLRLVNSVYYGITTPVNSIEEAVFYLGVRQIRQLAMVTPVIEDFQKLAGKRPFHWKGFWQHCIGTAVLTREVIGMLQTPVEEIDYVCGLVHDVGKIAMSAAFPAYFDAIYTGGSFDGQDLISREIEILGIDHCELGAIYLKRHNLPDALVETARFHHQPERASHHAQYVAAVQIADMLVRFSGIGTSGNPAEVLENDWINASGWDILFPGRSETEKKIAHANLKRSLERLPTILEGLL
jgi:putative nucleotidyltransferase with HDIG domain